MIPNSPSNKSLETGGDKYCKKVESRGRGSRKRDGALVVPDIYWNILDIDFLDYSSQDEY